MLEIVNLCLSYHYKNLSYEILKNLNLTVNEKDFIFIKGESGIGKTSLFKILGGFIKQDSGEIEVANELFPDLDTSEKVLNKFRKSSMGFVFQDFKLIPKYNVLENLLLPFKFTSIKKEEQHAIIHEMLERFHLLDKINSYPIFLSGGEIQKISIIRSLVRNPKLIIADEPFSNLDEQSTKDILEMFIELNQKNGITFLISTHHLNLEFINNKINYKLYHIKSKSLEEVSYV